MARWFDDAAKSAARREVAGKAPFEGRAQGLTRRTALKRGAVVAGVAWTAPMLMQTRAYAGASQCPAGSTYCPGANGQQACCLPGETCSVTGGVASCIPPDAPGGICSNNGVGVCTSSTGVKSNCNGHENPPQCNACAKPHICGGEAAECDAIIICAPNLTCTTSLGSGAQKFCRKPCAATTDCASGQICDSSGYCAQTCTVKGDCNGNQACIDDGANKICTYV